MASTTYSESSGAVSSRTVAEPQSPAVQRISWSAIFASVVVAVAVQLLLSMLGVGIGLGLVEPMAGDTPGAGSFGIGAGLWWLVSNLLALVAGGYVAAWLAGNTLRFDGMLHGLVTWGITLLLTFYLLGSVAARLIYSLQGNRLLLFIYAIGLAAHVALNLLLMRDHGAAGLALSLSLTHVVYLVLYAIAIRLLWRRRTWM